MIISDDLAFNIFKDWEKRNVSAEDKSKFLKEYLEQKNISQRELAKILGISHSTLHDWVSMRQFAKSKKYLTASIDKANEFYSLLDRLNYVMSIKECKIDVRTHRVLVKVLDKLKELDKDVNKWV